MKICHVIMISILMFIIISCEKGYEKPLTGDVKFNGIVIKVHDKKSFRIISKEFAVDEVSAYYRGIELTNSHGPSFHLLDDGYAADKYQVYHCSAYRDGMTYYTKKIARINILIDEEPVYFKVLDSDFAAGNRFAYWKGEVLSDSHGPSFRCLEGGFGRDQNIAYFQSSPVYGSHGPTFRVLEQFYSRDQRQVFYKTMPLNGADPATFRVLGYAMGKDQLTVYKEDEPLPWIHAPTFKMFESSPYAVDQYNAYYLTEKIPGADIITFEARPNSDYARDKNYYYYRLESLTPESEAYEEALKDYR